MALRQKQPNEWSCLPTAFGIVTEIPVNDMIMLLSHDGSEIIDPGSTHPWRAFHPQEIIWALRKEWMIVEHCGLAFVVGNEIIPDRTQFPSVHERFLELRSYTSGVYGYSTANSGHAVAWDHTEGVFIDPKNGDLIHTVEGQADIFWSVERRIQQNATSGQGFGA